MLLFPFDQETVDRSANQTLGQVLQIPEKIVALKKTFLSIPAKHFNWNRDTVVDIVLNVSGFIPLGAACYGLLSCFSGPVSRHKYLATVIFCMVFSLGIEFSQAWIPTRVSSLLDFILNTVGALIGLTWLKVHKDGLGKFLTG